MGRMVEPRPPNRKRYEAGDIGFCHSPGMIGHGIRWSEWLRFKQGSHYNHVFTLDTWHEENNGYWTVIQADAHGVTNHHTIAEATHHGSYEIFSPPPYGRIRRPSSFSTEKQLEFLRSQVGAKYGYLTILSIVTTLVLPNFINVMLPNTWICSALAAEALRAGGWIHNWPDIYQTNPAQLYEVLTTEEEE